MSDINQLVMESMTKFKFYKNDIVPHYTKFDDHDLKYAKKGSLGQISDHFNMKRRNPDSLKNDQDILHKLKSTEHSGMGSVRGHVEPRTIMQGISHTIRKLTD